MKSDLKYLMRCKVLAVSALYLFVTVSYIFFLSCIASFNSTNKLSFKSSRSESYLQRADKATFKGNEKSPVQALSLVTMVFQAAGNHFNNYTSALYISKSRFSRSSRYCYLSFLSLRI